MIDPANSNPALPSRIAVVGGGITGLAAAHRLRELLPQSEVVLFESSQRLGGVLQTVQRDGFLIERSADNFLTREPWATDLCNSLGLAEDLLPTAEARRRAFTVRDGRLVPVPAGFVLMAPRRLWPMLTSPVLSLRGKFRLLCEPLIPARKVSPQGASPQTATGSQEAGSAADESVASFARRRLGREAFERLVQPLLSGIYTADPEKLSMTATMPDFLRAERQLGGLLLAMRGGSQDRTQKYLDAGARYALFVAPRGGMESLLAALRASLTGAVIRTGAAIASIRTDAGGAWLLHVEGSDSPERFDGVILAAPAAQAANMLQRQHAALSERLAAIEHAGVAVVSLGFADSQLARQVDGFGIVIPRCEGRRAIAASFSSYKFPGRAPDGHVLVRVYLGGAMNAEWEQLGDQELVQQALRDLDWLLGVSGPPVVTDVARWPAVMPQYHVGHLARVAEIERLAGELPRFELAGKAYRGVGIPQCIHSGRSAAERLIRDLGDA